MADRPKETLSVEEAGRVLGLSRGSAYKAAREGQIPTLRIGRRLLVPKRQLYALLEGEEWGGPR